MARKNADRSARDEASIEVAAPPDRLYDLVSDITRMGRLSPECTGGKWLGDASGPAVGASFKGRNRRGLIRWSTVNRVVEANRGREFAFETAQSGTRWGYLFEPRGDTTLVTEFREPFRKRPLVARVFAKLFLGGVREHEDEMVQALEDSLGRLKEVAESPETETGRRRGPGRGRQR